MRNRQRQELIVARNMPLGSLNEQRAGATIARIVANCGRARLRERSGGVRSAED